MSFVQVVTTQNNPKLRHGKQGTRGISEGTPPESYTAHPGMSAVHIAKELELALPPGPIF